MSGRKIFVCYRREDSAGHAGRLYDRLNMRFPGRIFMDVAGIGLGTRWAEVIEQTLASCEVVLLLIGRRWLECPAGGSRRVDDPDDPLRTEIATALRLQLKMVPVLVGGAAMPSRSELPTEIDALADWQAMRVDDDDFDHDATRLIRALENQLTDEGADPHLEEAAARTAQIEALFKDVAKAVQAQAWVIAAQTLRAILSLDPGNAQATLELREVERRSVKTYSAGPRPVAARPGRWAALGALAALAALAVVGCIVLFVALIVWSGAPVDPELVADDAVEYPYEQARSQPGRDGEPEDQPSAAPTLREQLIGQYDLAGYSQQGMRLPLVGRLTLADGGQGRLRFETDATNQSTGQRFFYRGVLQQQDDVWTSTTIESNDLSANRLAIPMDVRFEGGMLVTTSAFGETAVWQRR